jgi:hypothetical protein
MATTTNYGWETPDDTDLVKDGALAMRDLGQDVDTSLFGITGGANVGMVHLNTTAFTSTSTVTIDNIFSSAYDSYQIWVNATSSNANDPTFSLRVGGVTAATNYAYTNIQGLAGSASSTTVTGATNALVGRLDLAGGLFVINIVNPAVAARTFGHSNTFDSANVFRALGFTHTTATAYDGFVLGLANSTGNVRIYGMRKS